MKRREGTEARWLRAMAGLESLGQIEVACSDTEGIWEELRAFPHKLEPIVMQRCTICWEEGGA